MPTSHQLGLDLAQLRPHPLRLGDARELKPPVLGLPADMREAQKPERLRLAESPRLPSLGREPAELDQAQDALVRDPVLEEPQQPAVVDGVVEATDVRVEHPAHLPPQDPGRERIQRLMRAAPRPKPVTETEKVRLEDGVQYLDDGTLE